jgi:hypothetical protein
MPVTLEFLPIYLHSMLREPLFNTKTPIPKNIIYENYLFFIQSSLESVFNHLYPKIFPVHNIDVSASVGVRVASNSAWSILWRRGESYHPSA